MYPVGVPHMALEDGFIGGYSIPKGSLILSNLWFVRFFLKNYKRFYPSYLPRNMLHDPETYPDPFRFDPERHIASPGKEAQCDPRNVCFGYGRRICPGMFLAEATLFACIATSLAVFKIEKLVVNGVPIIPVHQSTSGIIRCLLDNFVVTCTTVYWLLTFLQLPKAISMRHQASIWESSNLNCRIGLNLLLMFLLLVHTIFPFLDTQSLKFLPWLVFRIPMPGLDTTFLT